MSSMVNCFFRLSTCLTLSVDYENYLFDLSKKFFGKTAFSFNLYRNDGNQATVTSGE
jgi:hypothetical protein